MLIQLPSGSTDQPGPQNAEDKTTAFEAGLRSDLASSSIVSYDSMLGGWSKRVVELTLTIVTAPIWAPIMLAAAGFAKLRNGAPAFISRERIGYGGRAFNCYSLQVVRPAPKEETDQSPVANDTSGRIARRGKWRRVFERLPQLFNVIRGEMALIGPAPLTREQLEPMRSARRYYLSARPGVIDTSTIIGGSDDPSQYKIYAMSWALLTDALIMWDAVRSLFDRSDELWKPSFTRAEPGQSTSGIVVRQRKNP